MLDGKIIRGTTPTHTYVLPFDGEKIIDLSVTYSVGKEIIIKKFYEDCSREGNTVKIKFTQEDTSCFPPDKIAEAQLKVSVLGGEVLVSSKYYLKIEDILDEEVFEV